MNVFWDITQPAYLTGMLLAAGKPSSIFFFFSQGATKSHGKWVELDGRLWKVGGA